MTRVPGIENITKKNLSILYAVLTFSTSAESAESAHKDKQDLETPSVLE